MDIQAYTLGLITVTFRVASAILIRDKELNLENKKSLFKGRGYNLLGFFQLSTAPKATNQETTIQIITNIHIYRKGRQKAMIHNQTKICAKRFKPYQHINLINRKHRQDLTAASTLKSYKTRLTKFRFHLRHSRKHLSDTRPKRHFQRSNRSTYSL